MKFETLVIDDDVVVVMLAKRMITTTGLHPEPRSFPDGAAAIEFLRTQSNGDSRYLIFLDINMPVMNGWEFLEALDSLEISSQVVVFIVSSSSDRADRERAATFPLVRDYLEKPVTRMHFEQLKDRQEIKVLREL